MSYCTWHNYGYGFPTSELLPDSADKMEALLKKAPEYRSQVHEWFDECDIKNPTVDDYLEFDQDYCLGLATILKEVIWEATGIELLSCDDFNGERYVLYMPSYPWNMTERDRTITRDELDKVFKEFVSIITDKTPDIDFQSVENGG